MGLGEVPIGSKVAISLPLLGLPYEYEGTVIDRDEGYTLIQILENWTLRGPDAWPCREGEK